MQAGKSGSGSSVCEIPDLERYPRSAGKLYIQQALSGHQDALVGSVKIGPLLLHYLHRSGRPGLLDQHLPLMQILSSASAPIFGGPSSMLTNSLSSLTSLSWRLTNDLMASVTP